MKDMDDKGSDFCSIHYYLHTYNSWEIQKVSLAYEDCKMKDNGEGKNSLLVSLLVNTKSVQRRVMLFMMIRYILDQIQNKNKYQI